MTNILDLADQALFLGERATGATSVIQCIWVYDRAIDIDGLRRFHHHLQRGRLARRIERSPLPFGRHRWVMGSDSSDIEFTQTPRPREEFDAWLTDQAHTSLDAEHGPITEAECEEMVRAADLYDVPVMIRVPANEPHVILKMALPAKAGPTTRSTGCRMSSFIASYSLPTPGTSRQ